MDTKLRLAELVALVAASSGVSKRQAEAFLRALSDTIRFGLERDGHVRLEHFGSFDVRTIPAHRGRHPRTGAPLEVPATRRVVFHPGEAVRRRINRRYALPPPSRWALVLPAMLSALCVIALAFAAGAMQPEPAKAVALETPLRLTPPGARISWRAIELAPIGAQLSASPARLTHVVSSGETLSFIASRYLHSAAKWPLFLRSNPTLTNPNRIRAGDLLVIPGAEDH